MNLSQTQFISKTIPYHYAIFSQTAFLKNIENDPDDNQLIAMKAVAENIYEKLVDEKLISVITSFYRSFELNKEVGGLEDSQHCKGEAIDLVCVSHTNKFLFDYIKDNLEFDELIWEFGDENQPEWVHVSFSQTYNRKIIRYESKD